MISYKWDVIFYLYKIDFNAIHSGSYFRICTICFEMNQLLFIKRLECKIL